MNGEHLEYAIVHGVESERVDFEEVQRFGGDIFGDAAIAAHLGPVADAFEQAVCQSGRTPAAACDFERAIGCYVDVENRCRTHDDRGQLFGRVVLEPESDAETVAQRPGEQAGTRCCPDEGEARQIESDRAGGRALAHHDIERKILERAVEHFFDHAVHAVDLVDEQHVTFFEIGENRRKIARALNRWTARRLDVGAHLVCGRAGPRRGCDLPCRHALARPRS